MSENKSLIPPFFRAGVARLENSGCSRRRRSQGVRDAEKRSLETPAERRAADCAPERDAQTPRGVLFFYLHKLLLPLGVCTREGFVFL